MGVKTPESKLETVTKDHPSSASQVRLINVDDAAAQWIQVNGIRVLTNPEMLKAGKPPPGLKPMMRSAVNDPAKVGSGRRILSFLEATLPARYTREEIGDALEQIAALKGTGASKWRVRRILAKSIFWLLFNVARDTVGLVAALFKLLGH